MKTASCRLAAYCQSPQAFFPLPDRDFRNLRYVSQKDKRFIGAIKGYTGFGLWGIWEAPNLREIPQPTKGNQFVKHMAKSMQPGVI